MLQNGYFLVKFVCTQKMRKNYAIFMQRVPILHMSAKLVTKIKKVGWKLNTSTFFNERDENYPIVNKNLPNFHLIESVEMDSVFDALEIYLNFQVMLGVYIQFLKKEILFQ